MPVSGPHYSQGEGATETMETLTLDLRQAKRELAIRDAEGRRLRSAVAHLERTLAQREREHLDTVVRLGQ